jgi:alpha-D-xyloside xylohydrolase
MGDRTDKPDYDYSDGVTLQVYGLEEGKRVSVEIPSLDGKIETVFNVRREEGVIHIQRRGSSRPWNVLMAGIDALETTQESESVNGSTFIKGNAGTNELSIRLR